MTSCNALVYEAIQRVYRNAVVDLIRTGMQAAHPDDYVKRVTSAFPTWDDNVSAAARSAVTGVVAHPHQDVFDYLDVSHFPLLLNNYFSVLAPVEGLPPDQANELKRQVVSYAREIKTIRDPLSHPGTPDISPFDALRALDNASRALRVLGLPEAAEKIEPLLREVAAKASAPGIASRVAGTVGKPVRLLPRPGVLAGRDDLLTGLHVRLTSGADTRPRTRRAEAPRRDGSAVEEYTASSAPQASAQSALSWALAMGTEFLNEGVGLVGSAVEMLASVAISGSVGRGGKNRQRDVLVVSRRLGQLGYPVGSDPDSFIASIEKYQAEVVGLDPPDGRIDPDGQTIAALRQLKGAKGSASGAPTPAEHVKGGSGAGSSAHTGAGPEADYLTQNLNTYKDADTGKWEALTGTCNVTSLSMALTSLAGEDVVRSKVAALLARRGVPKGATCEIRGTRQAMSQVITNPDLVKQAPLPDLVAAAAIMVGPTSQAWNKKLQNHAVLQQVAIDAGLATATPMDKPLTDPKVRQAAKELLDNGSRVVGTTPDHVVDIVDVRDDGVVIHDPAGARVSLSPPWFLNSTPRGGWESGWLSVLSTDDRRDTALRRAQTNPDIRPIVERLVEISKITDKKQRSAEFAELHKLLPGFIAMGARNFYDLKDLKVYDARVAFSLSAPK